jgi:hypothetical protein
MIRDDTITLKNILLESNDEENFFYELHSARMRDLILRFWLINHNSRHFPHVDDDRGA